MNVSNTTCLTRELKPLEAPFLPTDDPQILWLKYQILIYFEDWFKTMEVRPEVYETSDKQKKLYNHKSLEDIKISIHTVTQVHN